MFSDRIFKLAQLTLTSARDQKLKIATAESCTGGLIIGALTEIAGSSDVVDRGFITYSNEAKRDMLNIPGDMIMDYGAVSEPVARAMADGALNNSMADLTIAVTGVAGPSGGTAMKPVGLVHIASASGTQNVRHDFFKFGDIGRDKIREQTVEEALNMLLVQLGG